MGDPGVAKSQLLSFIDRLAPRSKFNKYTLSVIAALRFMQLCFMLLKCCLFLYFVFDEILDNPDKSIPLLEIMKK